MQRTKRVTELVGGTSFFDASFFTACFAVKADFDLSEFPEPDGCPGG
jgi:hypothetical protein